MTCIVCKSKLLNSFTTQDKKIYWECSNCSVKFLDKSFFIDKGAEKQRYLEHQNEIGDPSYIKFLSKLSEPLERKLKPEDHGLDFGCGHGPALATMLKDKGYKIDLYDPFFYPNKEIFTRQYNFITCTETAEHFFNPYYEFKNLNSLLLSGGWLGVMTTFLTEDKLFENWYYRRDPTHVVFYAKKTFEIIAEQNNWEFETPTKDVALFYKH
jgi:2-polyprenyl-3-methyl-5-hydroxy-6-metoxy-1,4-benzoquinol methylase